MYNIDIINMNEKDALNNDEKINQIVSYLNVNNEMIDIIYSKIFNTNDQFDVKDKKK